MTLLAVALGGFLGAVMRFGISLKIQGMKGILIINCVGSFLMGLSLHLAIQTNWVAIFWMVGFLGAFTTFSTFAVQFVEGWSIGEHRKAIGYALFTLIGGFLSVMLGWWIGAVL
ncbi:fluoride efflux transporter FluC [Paenisporosarcina sp. NPDC076898]|uniref:fluoride efflux transporter FluC n=1 Tax=unclassified Paenisporosarcina TaxID=2642018 RepID=UPI003D03B7BC